MHTSRYRLTLLACAVLAVLAAASPDRERFSLGGGGVVHAQDVESARARWESLSPDERARLQERFERYKRMEVEMRERLARRAESLRRTEARVMASLSERDRERLRRQPAEKRAQILAEWVEAEERSRGRRLEAKLPDSVREWLEQATPEQRRARLEIFKRDTRQRTSMAAVERIAAQLGFGQPEIERLKRLPVEERMKKVLELHKRVTSEALERSASSRGLDPERWRALDALPPRAYFAEIMALRADGVLGEPREESAEGDASGAADRASELRELGRDLARTLSVRAGEHLDLVDLSREERRRELSRRRRERVMTFVRERDVLSEEQLAFLEGLSEAEFFRHIRRLSHRARQGGGPELPVSGARSGD